MTTGGPRLVRILGPGKNRTMRNSYQLSSTQTNFHQYEFTNNRFHQYEFCTYSTKNRTSGIRTSGDRTSGGPPVCLKIDLVCHMPNNDIKATQVICQNIHGVPHLYGLNQFKISKGCTYYWGKEIHMYQVILSNIYRNCCIVAL